MYTANSYIAICVFAKMLCFLIRKMTYEIRYLRIRYVSQEHLYIWKMAFMKSIYTKAVLKYIVISCFL